MVYNQHPNPAKDNMLLKQDRQGKFWEYGKIKIPSLLGLLEAFYQLIIKNTAQLAMFTMKAANTEKVFLLYKYSFK